MLSSNVFLSNAIIGLSSFTRTIEAEAEISHGPGFIPNRQRHMDVATTASGGGTLLYTYPSHHTVLELCPTLKMS